MSRPRLPRSIWAMVSSLAATVVSWPWRVKETLTPSAPPTVALVGR